MEKHRNFNSSDGKPGRSKASSRPERPSGYSLTLGEFTEDWFIYDRCPYIQGKIRRGGHFSRSFALIKRSQLETYILPVFAEVPLQQISEVNIEDWLFSLKERGLSHTSINHFYATLRIILKEAYRRRLIEDNPTDRVQPFIAQPKEKGIITQEEAEQLFRPGALKDIWQGNRLSYLMNLTASQTGMRLGEIQALHREDVYPRFFQVRRSWDRKFGEKMTKSRVERSVPVPPRLTEALLNFSRDNPLGPYIFSLTDGRQPCDHKAAYKWLYRAFEAIGIDEDQRKERNLTFHSWRHYYNSLLRLRGVPDHITKQIIGHQDAKMTDHYTHFHPDELAQALKADQLSLEVELPGDKA